MTETMPIDAAAQVEDYLTKLQESLCAQLGDLDKGAEFHIDQWTRKDGLRGRGDSRVLSDGDVFERLGINLSVVAGDSLPDSATARRPELAGRGFRALGVSLVAHPKNPYAPTAHMNVRFFATEPDDHEPVWWFGGGFDLTPYYGFAEDARHWHSTAAEACIPFGEHCYPKLKKDCDDYFYLRHRQEPRGIGGLFFDDWQSGGFAQSFALMRSVGDHFLPAYTPILKRRITQEYGDRERQFQLYRRGRYVEFNLVYDRGTLFGLQSGGRIESILMSMPPLVKWDYDWQPEPGSAEEKLYQDFLRPRDWLAEGPKE